MGRSRQYFAETIMDADYTDDLTLLANTPTQAKFLLHSLEQAAEGSGLYANSDKRKFMCYKLDAAISIVNKPLKLVGHFTYIGNNISSIERNNNICIGKAWIAIYRLLTISSFW